MQYFKPSTHGRKSTCHSSIKLAQFHGKMRIWQPCIQLELHPTWFKGAIRCKIHITGCLNLNVCWKCVYIHPIMIKIHQQFFLKRPTLKSPFSNQAVLRFLSEWHSSVQAPPTIVDWQGRLSLDPPWESWVNWVSCHSSTIVSTPVQGKTRCLRLSD